MCVCARAREAEHELTVLKQPCRLKPIYSCIYFMTLRKGFFCYCERGTKTADTTYCVFIIF